MVDVTTTEADVIACFILFYWLMFLPIVLWQMLWPHVIAMWWQMLLPSGRWNSHYRVGGY